MVVWGIASQRRKQESPIVLFTGGGSGGHVYPGLAVARELSSRRSVRIVWVGSDDGIEREIVNRAGLEFSPIPSGKLRRYLSLKNLADVFRVLAGIVRSIGLMRRLRPALVFSKGGYVSVPPVIAARLLHIPVVTHESDADPGLATRINARFSTRILVPYESTAGHFPLSQRERVTVTGNPLRDEILRGTRKAGLATAGFDPGDNRLVLMVLGGSLGARQLNEVIPGLLSRLGARWRIVHQTGERSSDLVLPESNRDYYRLPFIHENLPDLLACADAVLCRAGAGTIWEVAALGKAMLLVPLGAGSRGDQERNACVFEQASGALVFRSDHSLAGDLENALEELARDEKQRTELGRNAQQLIHIDSCQRIVAILGELLDAAGGDPDNTQRGRDGTGSN